MIYRVSGEALMKLACMSVGALPPDFDTVLAILAGADREAPMPNVDDGPQVGGDPPAFLMREADLAAKPAKPE